MDFKPTQEQQDIQAGYDKGGDIIVDAGAGTGKTSTIKMLANSSPDKTAIYLAFNKAIATEVQGKLPKNCIAKTTHSVAYQAVGKKYQEKLSRPVGRYVNVAMTPAEISRFFKIKPLQTVNDVEIAKLAKAAVANFESSWDESITRKNIPKTLFKEVMDRAQKRDEHVDLSDNDVMDSVLLYAEKLWSERKDTSSPVMATHDTYLKLYQLSKPVLDFDVIYLDEAQDSTPCVIDIVSRQTAQKIIVGDESQAIYQWRGSVNAMSIMKGERFQLSQSFRFGQEVANVANKILDGYGKIVLKGNPDNDTKVGDVDTNQPYTIICRTNGSLLSRAIDLIKKGVSVDIQTNTHQFCRKLQEAIYLSHGDIKKVKHEDLVGFSKWEELMDEVEHDGELKRIAKLVMSGEAFDVINTLKNYKTPYKAEVVLITAHKSKGQEYAQVILDNDFQELCDELPTQDRNLLYVACTRAMKTLELNVDLEMKLSDDVIKDEFKEIVDADVRSLEKDYKL